MLCTCTRHVHVTFEIRSLRMVEPGQNGSCAAQAKGRVPVRTTQAGATFSKSCSFKVQTNCKHLFDGNLFRQGTLEWMHSNMYNRRALQSNDEKFNRDIHSATSSSSASSSLPPCCEHEPGLPGVFAALVGNVTLSGIHHAYSHTTRKTTPLLRPGRSPREQNLADSEGLTTW